MQLLACLHTVPLNSRHPPQADHIKLGLASGASNILMPNLSLRFQPVWSRSRFCCIGHGRITWSSLRAHQLRYTRLKHWSNLSESHCWYLCILVWAFNCRWTTIDCTLTILWCSMQPSWELWRATARRMRSERLDISKRLSLCYYVDVELNILRWWLWSCDK